MLTFGPKGKPIAIVKGGKNDGKTIRLIIDDIDKKPENMIESNQDPLDYLTEDMIRSKKKKLSALDIVKIKHALTRKMRPFEDYLAEIYDSVKDKYQTTKMKEIIINDGEILPYPVSDGTSERGYIAGPSGSGKSTCTSKYANLFKKLYPDRKLYIFSDVEEDEVLDKLDPIRIKLDEQIYENPIASGELANSIVIFDDIDSIMDKKIKNAVETLRDSLLKRGRHENITVVCTSHQITNYKETRVVLGEANYITVFPRSGSTNGIQYVLKKYCGFNSDQIDKIMNLPSRWVSIYKTYPLYVIYNSGVYVV